MLTSAVGGDNPEVTVPLPPAPLHYAKGQIAALLSSQENSGREVLLQGTMVPQQFLNLEEVIFSPVMTNVFLNFFPKTIRSLETPGK